MDGLQDDGRCGGWFVWGVVLGGLGLLAAAGGCLRANDSHCIFQGGDLACTQGACVFAPEGAPGASLGVSDNGCFEADVEQPPSGFIRVAYGLPRTLLADGDAVDFSSVQGLLRHLAGDRERTTNDEIEGAFAEVAAPVQAIRDALESVKGTRPARVELPSTVERDIVAYTDAIETWRAQAPADGSTTADTEGLSTTGDSPLTGTSTGTPCDCGEDETCNPAGTCVQCEINQDCTGRGGGPLCVDGQCVECEGDADCSGRLCDPEAHVCFDCTSHAQCQPAACDLFEGTCLQGEPLGVGALQQYSTLSDALAVIPPGGEGTIIVHAGTYDDEIVMAAGRTVALLADQGALPVWRDLSATLDAAQLRVTNGTVLIDGFDVRGGDDVSLQVVGGDARAWVDRSRLVLNDNGSVAVESGGELVLRNCFVGGSVDGTTVVSADGIATIIYSSILGGEGSAIALTCTRQSAIQVRNSVMLTLGGAPGDELDCASASVSGSVTESFVAGRGNESVGMVPPGRLPDWFATPGDGDLHLLFPADPAFANAVLEVPIERINHDIDGHLRRGANHAGADVPLP